ncbi:MAG: hypothetical protein K0M40_07000 [Prolixibacteraceae bacterium]|nr:hypothetical protein [Prolixibacteraceae bacterium]
MASNSESGHVKNVANFESLMLVISGFGGVYNPSNASITLERLSILAKNASDSLNLVNSVSGKKSLAIAARAEAIKPLSKLTTRILNALRSSGCPAQIVDSAQSLVRKIQGQRATPKLTEEQKTALSAEGSVKKEVSSSQMSFDNRIDSFDKLIQLLIGISQYTPNETELQVATLTNYYNTLKTLNTEAGAVETELSNARLSRNEILYRPGSGLVDTATAAKMYIKSLFEATSPRYKQVSGLAFTSIPKNKIPNEVLLTD